MGKDKFSKNLGNVNDLSKGIDKATASASKMNKVLNGTNKEVTKLNSQIKKINFNDAFKKAEKFTWVDNILGGITGKFDALAEKKEVFDTIGGRIGMAGKQMMGMGKSISKFTGNSKGLGKAVEMFGGQMMSARMAGKGLFGSVGAGLKSIIVGFKSGSLAISGILAGLGTALATVIGPIVAIGAAIYVLKRMFTLNIGGMQTKFAKFMGKVKYMWGVFQVNFNKVLMKLGPVVDMVLTPIFDTISGLFSLTMGLLKGVWYAIEPIFDVLADIGKEFQAISGTTKQAITFGDILKGIGTTLKWIGKVIGFLVKVLLFPLKIMIKIGVWQNKIAKSFTKWYLSLKPVQKQISFLKKGLDGIKSIAIFIKDIFVGIFDNAMAQVQQLWDMIIGVINKIPDAFLPESLEQLKTNGDSPAVEASNGNSSNNTINNNQNLTVNTSASPEKVGAFTDMLAKDLQINGA